MKFPSKLRLTALFAVLATGVLVGLAADAPARHLVVSAGVAATVPATASAPLLATPDPAGDPTPPSVADAVPTPAPALAPAPLPNQRAVQRSVIGTATPGRTLVADHAYAKPDWNSAYRACASYQILGSVTDAQGVIWLVTECGYIPTRSRP